MFSGGPAFNGSTSYIGQFAGGTQFFAIKDTGEVLQSTDIRYSVETSPAVSRDGKTVYVNTLDQSTETLTGTLNDRETPVSEGKGTQSLDSQTLTVKASHGGADVQASSSSPLVSKVTKRIYVTTIDKEESHESVPPKLYALNNVSLEVDWEYQIPGQSFSSPVEDTKGNVYFGSEVIDEYNQNYSLVTNIGRVISLDTQGKERWTLDVDSEPAGGPALYVQKGKLYLLVRTRGGHVMKIDAVNGQVIWDMVTNAGGFGSPVLGKKNGVVYVTTDLALEDGSGYINELLALDEATGDILWTYHFKNHMSAPVVGTDGIYFVTFLGDVIALDQDGNEKWKINIGHQTYYGFIGMNACGQLQIGTADGHVVAVGTESKGMDKTSDWPTYRGDYGRTGYMF